MDKRERVSKGRLFIFYSLLFSQSTSSCIAAANIYHTEVLLRWMLCLQRARAVLIFAAIHFLFAESISILDPNYGERARERRGSCDCAQKTPHRLIRLLQSQGQKIIWPGVMA